MLNRGSRAGLTLAAVLPLLTAAGVSKPVTEIAKFEADQGARRKFAKITLDSSNRWLEEDFYPKQGRPATPPAVAADIQRVEDRLLVRSKLPPSIRVVLDDCSDPTADSRKQGVVRLCDTLLPVFESEDELAWLLAHESAHVMLGHGNSDAVAGGVQGLAMIGSVAALVGSMTLGRLALVPGLFGFMHVLAVPNGLASGYRPPQELQADRLAVDLMVAAGYSPNEGATALGHVIGCGECTARSKRREGPGFWQSVFPDSTRLNTHPDSAARYKALSDYIGQHYEDVAFRATFTPTTWQPGRNDPVSRHVAFVRSLNGISQELEPIVAASVGKRPEAEGRAMCRQNASGLDALSGQAAQHRAYRRLRSALLFGCGQRRRSLALLQGELGTPQATTETMYMVMALALQLGDNRIAGDTLSLLWRIPSPGGLSVRKTDDLYDLGCKLHSRPLIEAVDRLCLPAMQGLPSGPGGVSAQQAFCTDHKVAALRGTCGSLFRSSAPQSPVGYLAFNDPYFQRVLPAELYP